MNVVDDIILIEEVANKIELIAEWILEILNEQNINDSYSKEKICTTINILCDYIPTLKKEIERFVEKYEGIDV